LELDLIVNPTVKSARAIETAEGKLISFYGTPAEGLGVLVIFDVPDPAAAAAISGVLSSRSSPECKAHSSVDPG
jgi:hypothetical protein